MAGAAVFEEVPLDKLALVKRASKSQYAAALDRIAAMKPGDKAVVVEVPKGKVVANVLSSLTSAIAFRKLKAPEGYMFRKGTTTGGKAAVYLAAAFKRKGKSKK